MSETVKVKPWGEDQGDHVLINKADFDPEQHELVEAEEGETQAAAPTPKRGKRKG